MSAIPESALAAPRLRWQILAATFSRLILNTAHRMVYPFLPAFSRGLGVPPEAIGQILAVRGALGMLSPFFGGLPDRVGRRQTMLVGLGVFLAGLTLVVLFPSYWTFAAFLVLVVVGKFIFDPAMQAYLGDRTPYNRRGLVIAVTELGWSGVALVGFPLVGLLIAARGWRAPFLPLAALALVGGLLLWLLIPRDIPHAAAEDEPRGGHWSLVWRNPAVLGAMGLGLLISSANELLGVVLGAWLEQSFALSVAALGLSTTVIGAAELAGEGLVAGLADRLGKRRAIGLGLAASALAYGALPFMARSLELALVGLFCVFLAFEFTMVASLPLMTELVPAARGRVMSANVASAAAGRMLGALLGVWLYRDLGFVSISLTSVLMNAAALVLLLWLVRERH